MKFLFAKYSAGSVKTFCLVTMTVLFYLLLMAGSTVFLYYVRRSFSVFDLSILTRYSFRTFLLYGVGALFAVLLCIFCTAVLYTADKPPSRLMGWLHNMDFIYFTLVCAAFAMGNYMFLVGAVPFTGIKQSGSFWIDGVMFMPIMLVLCPVLAFLSGMLWISSFLYRLKNKSMAKTMIWMQFFKCYPPNRRIGFFMLLVSGMLFLLALLHILSASPDRFWSLTFCVGQLGLLTFLALFLRQLWEIRFGIANPTIRIDRSKDIPYVKELAPIAESLDNLKITYERAIEEQIKAERFKTELITNVSHDIKTPLTSIINYVDLLKKLEIQNLQFSEYTQVLDKKAQRLKMLIEDLLEASKAGTGNTSLHMEGINLHELVGQIAGEFDEPFAKANLHFVFIPHSEVAYVWADGRQLWRVMENIFSNVAKYAMEGTRVYAEIKQSGERVYFVLRNIAKESLIGSDEGLTNQFIRGDKSRGSEGSGLGLYIAKSLAELMEIGFAIETRGDLFEVQMEINTSL